MVGVAALAAVALAIASPLVHGRTPPPRPPRDPRRTVDVSVASGRLLFIGASYSIGVGATGPAKTIPDLLATQLHRAFEVDAVSGTGFQNPGPHDQGTFAERLMRDPDDPAPRIVVIQGGRDDASYPIADEYAAALHTIELAQQRFSHAQVVLLGPIPGNLPVNARVSAIRPQLERAAATAHAGFIDPIADHWVTPQNLRAFRGRVAGHPNNAGYAYFADKLLAALPAALAASQPPLAHPPVSGEPVSSTERQD
jgi:hypothetical protein